MDLHLRRLVYRLWLESGRATHHAIMQAAIHGRR
jgi:hypothetical protein